MLLCNPIAIGRTPAMSFDLLWLSIWAYYGLIMLREWGYWNCIQDRFSQEYISKKSTRIEVAACKIATAYICAFLDTLCFSSDALKVEIHRSSVVDSLQHRLVWSPYVPQEEEDDEPDSCCMVVTHGSDVRGACTVSHDNVYL